MKPKTRCYIYTRVSTAMQVDGFSLEAQKEKLRSFAAFQEMEIAGEYCDEGFSGKNIQGRLAFRQMLQDIEARKDGISYVLVFKLSRFGRNAADVLNSLQLMQDYGVNLICVEDGIYRMKPEKTDNTACGARSGGGDIIVSDGATLYVTASPCIECAKLIIQSGIKRVIYTEQYRLTDGVDLLRRAGIEVEYLDLNTDK